MNFINKLKPAKATTQIIEFTIFLVIGLSGYLIGGIEGVLFLGVLVYLSMCVLNLIAFFRTNNIGYFVLTCVLLSVAFLCWGMRAHLDNSVMVFAVICTVIFAVWILLLIVQRKFKWRSREILELAARPVEHTTNGFTPRPFAVGTHDYKKWEILAFAQFMFKNLASIPFITENGVVFAFDTTFWHVLGLKRNYEEYSYVAINYDGELSVNISKKSYEKYQDEFTFDQLCQSLGNVFKEFFEWYRAGRSEKIINKMNSLQLNPFIET